MMDHLGLIALGFAASLATGLATGLGALPAVFLTRATDKLMDGMLGFAAGVMLAVTVFGLLIPAIDEGGIWVTMLGLVVGMAFLFLMDSFTPHPHFILNAADFPNSSPARLRRIWLLLLAITIHNLPEGFAVGVTFGTEHIDAGVVLALGIGIQNLPEGLAVALPLVREGYSPRRGVGYATLSGLAEPLAGLVGVSLVVLLTPSLPAPCCTCWWTRSSPRATGGATIAPPPWAPSPGSASCWPWSASSPNQAKTALTLAGPLSKISGGRRLLSAASPLDGGRCRSTYLLQAESSAPSARA